MKRDPVLVVGFALTAICVVLLPLGCSTEAGKRIGTQELSQIREGESSRAEVERLLGKPTCGLINPLSNEVTLNYSHSRGPGGIPPPPIFAWSTRYSWDSQSVWITIGTNNIVKKIQRVAEVMQVRSGNFKATVKGQEIDFTKAAQIREGKTNRSELEALLGAPQRIVEDQNTVTYRYKWSRTEWDLKTGAFQRLDVILDADGVVRNVTKDSGRQVFHGHWKHKVDWSGVSKLQPGETTRAEAEALLGQPSSVVDEEGATKARTILGYGGIIRMGFHETLWVKHLWLSFDRDGKLDRMGGGEF